MFSPAAYCKLECGIPRQELAAAPVWVQTISLQAAASTASILFFHAFLSPLYTL